MEIILSGSAKMGQVFKPKMVTYANRPAFHWRRFLSPDRRYRICRDSVCDESGTEGFAAGSGAARGQRPELGRARFIRQADHF